MQFHLGVTPEIIDDWLRQDAPSGDLRESAAPIEPMPTLPGSPK
jgi:hypothetical protein